MIYSDYEFYYNDVIKAYYEELKKIDNEFFSGKAIELNDRKMVKCYYMYETMRKKVRRLYMIDERKPMDRHKIAACFLMSILKVRPVRVHRIVRGLPLELLLANEYLALYTALNLLENYCADIRQNDSYRLVVPLTYIKNEKGEAKSYFQNTCKALFYHRKFQVGDVFLLANVLFLLEKYTDCVLEQKETFEK